jgi:hypothetical protein
MPPDSWTLKSAPAWLVDIAVKWSIAASNITIIIIIIIIGRGVRDPRVRDGSTGWEYGRGVREGSWLRRLREKELGLRLQSPPLQKYSISGQPPRPESRSDSFARTESFLREHSRQLSSSSLSNHSNGNHVAFDLDGSGSLASPSRQPSRPESRNNQQNGYLGLSNGLKKDSPGPGLLVMVDHHHHQHQQQQQQQSNSADPLVSLIQSLAEIKPLSDSLVATPQLGITNSFNNGPIKAEQSLLFHTSTHQQSATIITVASNAINSCTTALNHSPKAWLSSNTQVR